MRLLVKNIAKIVGLDEDRRVRAFGKNMDYVQTLDDAWLVAEDGRIADYGVMANVPSEEAFDRVVDAEGGMLFPTQFFNQ